MDQVKIGEFLKELRKQKNLTQQEAADALYVSQKTISRWETGEGIPDVSIIAEVAKFYNVTVDDILNGEKQDRIKIEVIDKEIKNENNEQKIIKKMNIYFFVSTGIIIFFMIFCLVFMFTVNNFNLFIIIMPIAIIIGLFLYLFGYNECKREIKDNIKEVIINKNVYFSDIIFTSSIIYILYISFLVSVGYL